MSTKKVRKPVPKKPPVKKKKIPAAVKNVGMTLEQKLAAAKQARDAHRDRYHQAVGHVQILEGMIAEEKDAKKEV